MSGLSIKGLKKHYGSVRALDGVDIEVATGERIALLGPSGCGKTTVLRCIAGLIEPTEGAIRLGDRVLWESGGRGLPTEERDIGLVFQSYALWPHMSVFENVAYPLRVRRSLTESEIRQLTLEALEMVGMAHREKGFPAELSGGQQQRVALARNIAMQPKVLLFDEPLSNLDVQLRDEMRFELASVMDRLGTTAVYVTHDQAEAFAIADRVVVMNYGQIEQVGVPSEVYEKPTSTFVARFVGQANIFEVRAASIGGSGLAVTSVDGGITFNGIKVPSAGAYQLMVRPEVCHLVPDQSAPASYPDLGPLAAVISGIVRQVHNLGARTVSSVEVSSSSANAFTLRIDSSTKRLRDTFSGHLPLSGDSVVVAFAADDMHLLQGSSHEESDQEFSRSGDP